MTPEQLEQAIQEMREHIASTTDPVALRNIEGVQIWAIQEDTGINSANAELAYLAAVRQVKLAEGN